MVDEKLADAARSLVDKEVADGHQRQDSQARSLADAKTRQPGAWPKRNLQVLVENKTARSWVDEELADGRRRQSSQQIG